MRCVFSSLVLIATLLGSVAWAGVIFVTFLLLSFFFFLELLDAPRTPQTLSQQRVSDLISCFWCNLPMKATFALLFFFFFFLFFLIFIPLLL